jgi:hypothetical protein
VAYPGANNPDQAQEIIDSEPDSDEDLIEWENSGISLDIVSTAFY